MPGPIARMKRWLQRPAPQQAAEPGEPGADERLMVQLPGMPRLDNVPEQLQARYRAFVTQQRHDPSTGEQLVQALQTEALNLSYSKAHEQSLDIYWLTQGAAVVTLLTCGADSAAFKVWQERVHTYRDGALTWIQVGWFDNYVARLDSSSYLHVQTADMDELLAFLPRLYPDGAPIQAVVAWLQERWPVYDDALQAFFQAAGKDCWSDFNYDIAQAGQLIEDPELIAAASLDELKTLLTWCVRGERFCDGHHAAVIEKGYILRLLQRLQVLRHGERQPR